ncbi:MAG: radical SAM protein, partial [Kovacikia sp.]
MTQPVLPSHLRLETATHCQLKCPACETASGETHKFLGAGFLQFKDFKAIVDDNRWLSHFELSNWGELFLNPDILKMMEYAYQKNVSLSASNGSNLNTVKEAVLEGLVKYKFRHITCSIDGASQETYSVYRRGGNFDRVIENIRRINHYKQKYRSPFPL